MSTTTLRVYTFAFALGPWTSTRSLSPLASWSTILAHPTTTQPPCLTLIVDPQSNIQTYPPIPVPHTHYSTAFNKIHPSQTQLRTV